MQSPKSSDTFTASRSSNSSPNEKTIDAAVRNLEVIGEAVRYLSVNSEPLASTIPWADIAGMRNILIHEYFGVDSQIIWQTISSDLPILRVELQRLLRDTERP